MSPGHLGVVTVGLGPPPAAGAAYGPDRTALAGVVDVCQFLTHPAAQALAVLIDEVRHARERTFRPGLA
jgi:hypothetical protein